MRSGRSLLPLLLGVAFALWSPLLSVSSRPDGFPPLPADGSCSTFPTYFERCKVPRERYFYNVTSKRCQIFRDYGCPSNINSYLTRRKCQQVCSEIDVCQKPPKKGTCNEKSKRWFYDPKTEDCKKFTFGGCGGNANHFYTRWACRLRCRYRASCLQPPEVGPCDVLGKHWFYDQNTQRCKKFNSGMCGKNLNTFKTHPECRQMCLNRGSP